MYTVLHNSSLEIHGFWPKALQIHGFLEKISIKYIVINLTKCGFELYGFFSGPQNCVFQGLAVSKTQISTYKSGNYFRKNSIPLFLAQQGA